MSDAPALLQCCFLLSGTYKSGQTQTSMQQRIFDLGGTIASKLCDSVTHILCNDAEFAKQSAKVKAVLAHNAREDVPRIWIVDQAWLEETEEIGERPLEEEWDLELNLDEEDAQIDEEERQAREVKAQERKRKREEDADASVDLDEPTGATIDPDCHLAGKVHIHKSGHLPWHTYLLLRDEQKGDRFYIIQLLKSDAQSMFWVYTKSGKKTSSSKSKGQTHGPYGQVNVAIAQFEKKFKDKTKLTWKDRWASPSEADAYTVVQPVKAENDEFDDLDFDEAAFAEIDALDSEQQQQQQQNPSRYEPLSHPETSTPQSTASEERTSTTTDASKQVMTEEDKPQEASIGQPPESQTPPSKKQKVEENNTIPVTEAAAVEEDSAASCHVESKTQPHEPPLSKLDTVNPAVGSDCPEQDAASLPN